jgi:hypothetical protein
MLSDLLRPERAGARGWRNALSRLTLCLVVGMYVVRAVCTYVCICVVVRVGISVWSSTAPSNRQNYLSDLSKKRGWWVESRVKKERVVQLSTIQPASTPLLPVVKIVRLGCPSRWLGAPPSLPQIQTTGARGNHQRGANVIAAWAPAHPITAPALPIVWASIACAEEIGSGSARWYLRLQFLPASFAAGPWRRGGRRRAGFRDRLDALRAV